MALAVLVVDRDAAVEQLAERGLVERLAKLDRENRLGLVEEEAPVAVGAGDQRLARFGGDRKRALLDRLGAADQFLQRLMVEPAQDQYLAARQQRGVELEARILGGRADQRHRPVLDIGQEAVLLGAVEAMDFVHEQQGLVPGFRRGARLGEQFLQIGDAREHRRDGDKAQADGIGQQARDAGLAGPRRAPQDHRGEAAGGDHPSDRAVGAGQMLLPDDLGQRLRAQPIGQRRAGGRGLDGLNIQLFVGEQVGHGLPTISRPLENARIPLA